MPRALLITNPVAARTNTATVLGIVETFKRHGWTIDVVTTSGPGDARTLAGEGVKSGVDQVVIYGGDGTAMQAAAALVRSDVPLGLISGGTGNILAGNLRLPRRPLRAADVLVRGNTREIDVGRVDRDDGTHYFAVVAGAGFDAMMMEGTSAPAKRRWGMLAYIRTGIRAVSAITPIPHRVTVDGQTVESDAAMVLVANCPEIVPYWFPLRNNVRYDDGVFDVVIVKAHSVPSGLLAIWDLWRGVSGTGAKVLRLRGSAVRIETDVSIPVQLDGDTCGTTPFDVGLVPLGLNVVVP